MKPRDNTIKLSQFLKLMGIVPTGGQAKLLIQGGDVLLNGVVETRRGKRLVRGDQVTVAGQTFEVNLDNSQDQEVVTVFPEQTG
ncbi:RNA-binding S4 domain-containing protein [Komarekiella sp. 'clone 1']|jgi:ribosome-associated protein|uniref:RNA-binding S4 domain-containing protein n=1 Tax=Komarekiella delphini-convector SJRDD-AB1 TaxID=2593771 RepID=A0AA40T453_9NOST|nr:RNA-binding S4 domain-containing protein [Komarekiella delphini-convector]MBD6620606.1 RNA-binding S4 domain-containing protein [Komarekiella delphini-convector SJRDD-AB1]MBW4685887.1 RNA-binding S4 domain-containing protein [Komarekiella atlantica HA4396-MV6]